MSGLLYGRFAMDMAEVKGFIRQACRYHGTSQRLIALVLGTEFDPEMKGTFIPKLEYFHCRTDKHMDVLYPGYVGEFTAPPYVAQLEAVFNASVFNEFRKQLADQTGLTYGGGTELILLNAFLRNDQVLWALDHMLQIALEPAIAAKAIESSSRFMETIFQAAEEHKGPKEISNEQANKLMLEAMKETAISLTPKSFQDHLKRAFFLHTCSPKPKGTAG